MASIDVLIPAHNAEKTIARALLSVKNQTVSAGNVWVIADTCDDATATIAHQHGAGVVPLEAKSVAVARNVGLRISSATHVAFLDADDEWCPSWISAALSAMRQAPDALLYFGGIEERDERNRVVRLSQPQSASQTSPRDLALHNFVSTSACIVHRKSAQDAGAFDEGLRNASDWDLWLRMCEMGPLVQVPGHHAIYHRNEDSLSRAPGQMLRARDDALRVLYKAHRRGALSGETLRLARTNVLSLSAMRLLRQGRVREARIDLHAALASTPTATTPWLLAIWSGLPADIRVAAADARQRIRRFR